MLVVKGFESKNDTRDSTLLDVISVLEGGAAPRFSRVDLVLHPVDDVRDFVGRYRGEDCVAGHAREVREREAAQRAEEQRAFLKQINVFRAEDEEAGAGGSLELLDPEVMGELPILAKNNMEKMMKAGRGDGAAEEGETVDESDLRYVPVKVYGATPKGFTTLWQREYLRKKRAVKEERKRMMEMQMAMVQSAQSEQLNEQLNEMELAREGGAGLM